MLEQYNADKNDIIVIGHHGAMQLSQRGVSFRKYSKLPNKDKILMSPPLSKKSRSTSAAAWFYQQYIFLMNQEVKQISLSMAVRMAGLESYRRNRSHQWSQLHLEPNSLLWRHTWSVLWWRLRWASWFCSVETSPHFTFPGNECQPPAGRWIEEPNCTNQAHTPGVKRWTPQRNYQRHEEESQERHEPRNLSILDSNSKFGGLHLRSRATEDWTAGVIISIKRPCGPLCPVRCRSAKH